MDAPAVALDQLTWRGSWPRCVPSGNRWPASCGKFEIASPDGAFFLWAKAPAGMAGDAYVQKAIANNCLIIPGRVFSVRNSRLRIGYTVADAKLKQGAELLCRLAASPT